MLVERCHRLGVGVVPAAAARVPALGVSRGDARDDLRAAAADDDGRMRLLHRLGFGDRVLDLVEASLVGGTLLRPQRDEHAARFVQHPRARRHIGHRHAQAPERILIPSGAEADLEPTLRDVVDGRGDLREERGMPVDVADGATLSGLTIHPDGKRFATSVGWSRHDIWLIDGFRSR